MASEKERRLKLQLSYFPILQGIFLTLILLIVFALILAIITYFSDLQRNMRLLKILSYISIMGGSLLAGNKCEEKSWIHGLIVGIFLQVTLTFFAQNQELIGSWIWLKNLLQTGLFSILGGILGGLAKPT